jgi:hypothetical protein
MDKVREEMDTGCAVSTFILGQRANRRSEREAMNSSREGEGLPRAQKRAYGRDSWVIRESAG